MSDFPGSLIAFQRRFPDAAACAAYLAALRWPDGFRCPGCGHDRAWRLDTKAWTYPCKQCRRQTSVTAGTVMHGSKVRLTIWLWAAYLMATHSNGISAFQLWKQLGLGSYKTAWLLCAKRRHAMLDPDRKALFGLVEIDETTIHHRTKDSAVCGGQGRRHDGKLRLAVEVVGPGRIRLAAIKDFSATSLHGFIATNIAPATTAKVARPTPAPPGSTTILGSSAPWPRMWCCPGSTACSRTSRPGRSGSTTAGAQNTCNPISTRSPYPFNRRRTRHAGFRSLLRIASCRQPVTYKMLIAAEATG